MSVARLTPQEAHARLSGAGHRYLDVRTVAEFDAGHPEGAYNVPWQLPGPHGLEPNPHFLSAVRACFALEDPLVVGCASGVRSLAAAEALAQAGYTRVVELRAGFSGVRDPFGGVRERGWQAEGLPCAARAREGRDWAALSAGSPGGEAR